MEWRTPTTQSSDAFVIGWDVNWDILTADACYSINGELKGCVEAADYDFVEIGDDVSDGLDQEEAIPGETPATSGDTFEVPQDQVPVDQETVTVSVQLGDGSTASQVVTLTDGGDNGGGDNGDNGDGDNGNTFDYQNTVSGLTSQPVHYAEGTPKTGRQNAEAVTQRNSSKQVTGYVSEWAQYDRQFNMESIDPTAYTDLVYAFTGICGDQGSLSDSVAAACIALELEDGEMVMLDMFGGIQSAISQRQEEMEYNPAYDAVNKQNYDALNPSNARGLMGQLIELKTQNPNLKTKVSVGGWTLSEPFHRVAADPALRTKFNNSVVAFVTKWELDGVDVDWEFPGHGGESGAATPEDGDNFVVLLNELRSALDDAGLTDVTISSAVGATQQYIDLVGAENYAAMAGPDGPLDTIYLMNYDYWGAFTAGQLGHQTNLYGNSFAGEGGDNSASKAIELLDSYGVDKSKIILGIANYARGKQGTITEPGNPASATNVTDTSVFGTWEHTVVEGYDLFHNMAGPDFRGMNGFQLFTDVANNADYYYNETTGVYYSIDTPRTAFNKARYAESEGLGGVFVWTVEQDYNGATVNAMNDGLGNTLANAYSSIEERMSYQSACGENVSSQECNSLNNPNRLSVGEESINYSEEEADGESVIFHIPESNTVHFSQADSADDDVWEGNAEPTFFKAWLTSDTEGKGSKYVNFRAYKKGPDTDHQRINDGVEAGYGVFHTEFSVDDNLAILHNFGGTTARISPKDQPVNVIATKYGESNEEVAEFELDLAIQVPAMTGGSSLFVQPSLSEGFMPESDDMSQFTTDQEGIFFYMPTTLGVESFEADSVEDHSSSGETSGTKFVVDVLNQANGLSEHQLVLTGYKRTSSGDFSMNETSGEEAVLYVEALAEDNQELPDGLYTPKHNYAVGVAKLNSDGSTELFGTVSLNIEYVVGD